MFRIGAQQESLISLILFICRTPFELNSTFRYALLALFDAVCFTTATSTYCSVPSLLIAFMNYSEACCLDIESLFGRLDLLSERPFPPKRNGSDRAEWAMYVRFREVIDLHQKLIKYGISSAIHCFSTHRFCVTASLKVSRPR